VNAVELIETQLELECIGVTSDRLLVRLPGPNPDGISRFYITRHDGGYTAYFRYDLPRHIRERLEALPQDRAFNDHETVKRILGKDAPCESMWIGKSYVFPDTLTTDDYLDATQLDETHQTLIEQYDAKMSVHHRAVYAIIVDGRIVSTCESLRENAVSAEAWTRTLPAYRRCGYAQVTAAWAHNLHKQGKIPFYSHLWDNLDSQAVAQSLGLIQCVAGVGYG
jgi:hypothetical protein